MLRNISDDILHKLTIYEENIFTCEVLRIIIMIEYCIYVEIRMKLVFVRHGEPDYEHDSLTPHGVEEAKLLADRIAGLNADAYYVSPLGRAKLTASYGMAKIGKDPVELPWLEEFRGKCRRPHEPEKLAICWDWLPADWTKDPVFFDKDHWFDAKGLDGSNVKEEAQLVVSEFDRLLLEHGYERQDNYYRAVEPNRKTIVFFCHFGVTCVIAGHLLNVSPMVLLHGLVAAPTSVTTFTTEERREGSAYFRMSSYGDISHLYKAGMEPSFAARFCECFTDDTRH